MKIKKLVARLLKKSQRPIVFHIGGLYLEASPDDTSSLLDFVRMLNHAVGREQTKGGAT